MRVYLLFVLFYFFAGCQPANQAPTVAVDTNPPAAGFNLEGSDARAITIADSVMAAMGGRKNWDATRFIKWNFFGRRILLWDKHSGWVRIEVPADSTIFLANIKTDEGKVLLNGAEQTAPDSLKKYLEQAESIWINDSYWLVMPFKLKDSGVTLTYAGQDTTLNGETADVLELTFQEVGRTPENKYRVYVNPKTHLVSQWDFYRNASDPKPGFALPWENYVQHGGILLSGDRGNRKLSDIAVYQNVPPEAFTDFAPVDYVNLK